MPEPLESESLDVLPDPVNCLLASAWILLCGGRWILVNFFLAFGVLNVSQVAVLDNPILLRCYLALLCITILVAVLRVVRAVAWRSKPLD